MPAGGQESPDGEIQVRGASRALRKSEDVPAGGGVSWALRQAGGFA